ncbi:MAG TPA: potassium channel family protein [Candidatus Acidoferrales bacterium]|nr:potassium channel family protein [Candidatus Acidoferrales bacterium]
MWAQTLSLAAGTILIVAVLFDLFASVLVPRPVPSRLLLSAAIRRYSWRMWSRLFLATQPPQRREIILGFFAPLSVVVTLAMWLLFFIFGYGLLIWGLRDQMHPVPVNLLEASYYAGTSVLTIGYGDIVATGGAARAVSLAAGATGLATVAVVLAFLFSLFNSYRQREVFAVTLDAKAGSPPSGLALLETYAQLDLVDDLPRFFEQSQDWAADVLETHLAYPVLCYFRSTHVGMSWIAALGAVLDAATLVVSTIERLPTGEATLAHSVGTHLCSDVANYFRLAGPELTLVEEHEFTTACERLAAAGYTVRPAPEAWQSFTRLRSQYAASLNNLARYWTIEPAQWIGDRSPLEARHD